MYMIKNAAKNILRHKGRNLLIGLILLAVLTASAVAVVINTTSDAIISDYVSRFGSEVFLELDYRKALELSESGSGGLGIDGGLPGIAVEPLRGELHLRFAESAYLKEAILTGEKPVFFGGGLLPVGIDDPAAAPVHGTLIGTSRQNLTDAFASGAREIISGTAPGEKDTCIISTQFARRNSLTLGDTAEIISYQNGQKQATQLRIVGIYEDYTTALPGASQEQSNEILTTFDTVALLGVDEVEAQYFLKNPELLEAFSKELYSNGLPEYYRLRVDEAGYRAIVGPVESMTEVTSAFLWLVLGIGGLVLLVLSVLAVRERKYEIGVLRAMGMKKRTVAAGFLAETVLLTALALALSFGISAAASQPVADKLLDQQVQLAQEQALQDRLPGDVPVEAPETKLETVRVDLTVEAVLRITGIALLLTALSSTAGIVAVTRFEPMQILQSERN